jgi:hypothetical protein
MAKFLNKCSAHAATSAGYWACNSDAIVAPQRVRAARTGVGHFSPVALCRLSA